MINMQLKQTGGRAAALYQSWTLRQLRDNAQLNDSAPAISQIFVLRWMQYQAWLSSTMSILNQSWMLRQILGKAPLSSGMNGMTHTENEQRKLQRRPVLSADLASWATPATRSQR